MNTDDIRHLLLQHPLRVKEGMGLRNGIIIRKTIYAGN